MRWPLVSRPVAPARTGVTTLVAMLAVLLVLGSSPAGADLLVSSQVTDEVLRYHGTTGAFLGAFVTAGLGGLTAPLGVVFGPDGHLYVASLGTDQVLRYHGTTGAFLGAFVPAGLGGLTGPRFLVFTPERVPTLSEWGWLLMGGLLVATGLWALRRRRAVSSA